MRVEPDVSKRKFAREVQRLREQNKTLSTRGIFVAEAPEFPAIDLVFVPRAPLGLQIPVQQTGLIAVPEGMIQIAEVPPLAGRAFKARFDLTDYDLRAPSIAFLDPWTNTPIPFLNLVRGQEFESTRGVHPVILDSHPATGLPFLCLRGVREYHEHPQHSGDDWLLYRGDVNVFSLALAVWRVAVDLVRPVLVSIPNGAQVFWAAMEKA